MSVNISIDRRRTLEALLRGYNIIPFARISFGEPEHADIIYRDGWFFIELRISGKYPTVTHGRVYAGMEDFGKDGSVMLVYVHELRNFFFHFFELEKGSFSSYMGIELDDDGKLRYRNIPDGKSATLLPPGSIQPGDTLLSGLYIDRGQGTKRVRIIVKRVDFATRRLIDLVDYLDVIEYDYHVVSAYGPEPKGVPARFGIAFVATGPLEYYFDIAPWLLKYGLPDPREINPWR